MGEEFVHHACKILTCGAVHCSGFFAEWKAVCLGAQCHAIAFQWVRLLDGRVVVSRGLEMQSTSIVCSVPNPLPSSSCRSLIELVHMVGGIW